jgi:hypothetical protein
MAAPVSPQRYQRRASRWLMAMVVAVGALIFAVWLVGDQAARGVRESEAKARTEQAARDTQARAAQTTALRAGCARAVARDSEAWATNRDLRDFARDAEAARRASGDRAVARAVRGDRGPRRVPDGPDTAAPAGSRGRGDRHGFLRDAVPGPGEGLGSTAIPPGGHWASERRAGLALLDFVPAPDGAYAVTVSASGAACV